MIGIVVVELCWEKLLRNYSSESGEKETVILLDSERPLEANHINI